jgi:hypothetical protein
VLPLMPAFALAAARTLATTGPSVAWRPYAVTTTLLGVAFIVLPGAVSTPVSLTAAERATMVPAGIALGTNLLASVAALVLAARRNNLLFAAVAYAAIVISLPFDTAALMRAVGDDRSAVGIAQGIAPVLERAARNGTPMSVLGVAAYPPSLPFYLGRPIAVATATANELTSNYIAAYQERYRAVPGSPLKPLAFWQATFAACPTPTVFVAGAGDHDVRDQLAPLPLIALDHHYAAYGPCLSGRPPRAPGRASED